MDKPNQALQPAGIITKEQILALAWNIATEPKLYRELASNPYTTHALKIISERFPEVSTTAVIKAVILAEPEGKYDRNFKLLPKAQQEEELSKQKESTRRIHKLLLSYCKKHAKTFSRRPGTFVYNTLSFLIFKTTDEKEIEQKYAQNQRRSFRLAIVNFIEDTQRLKSSQQKTNFPWLKVIFALLVLTPFFYLTLSIIHHSETNKQSLETKAQTQTFPIRLKIPKINVDAFVKYVGITPAGAMDVPSNATDVGWYQLGPSPGEIGNAVISGHFDGRLGEAGVFNKLDKLKQGDKIYITNALGTTITFVVRTTHTYNPGYADAVFLSNDKGIHLNLITCDGVWNKVKKSYSKRLVVFTDIMH